MSAEVVRDKLREKNLDFIVANDVTRPGAGFDTETNAVTLLGRGGPVRGVCFAVDEVPTARSAGDAMCRSSRWRTAVSRGTSAAPDFRNDRIHDFPHVLRRIQMGFKLFFAPHRFKDLHQIRGRDDLHPKTPH